MIHTIHELLPTTRGNITELARILNCDRGTLRKYIKDKKGEFHVIVNGKLFVKPGFKGRIKHD
ncbi:TPA: protein ninH [Salmonella enterica subsp. enterica serovar Javiana]